jgi:DNA-binding transcriptional LysR family regulator
LSVAATEAARAGIATTGRLRLGFVWSFAAGTAAEIIAAFRHQNPNVRLQLTEIGAAELLKRTLDREIDCAWIIRWHDLEAVLETEPLWSEALYLAMPEGRGSVEPQGWDAFASSPYLCRATDEWRHFQRHLDTIDGPRMDIHAHDCSRESLLSLVAAGDGITALPESIARAGYPGTLMAPMADPRAKLEIIAIWRRETDNPALRRFLALAREWLRKNRTTPTEVSASG